MTRSGIFKNYGYNIAIITIALLLVGFVIAPVTGRTDVDIFAGYASGNLNAHPEIATMSELEKAKYAFSLYSGILDAKDAPVNSNFAGRIQSRNQYKCDWHTDNLEAMMRKLGVKEVHTIVADKKSFNFLDVNRNHEAVLVVIDGKPYVFDIWRMAVKNWGTYKSRDQAKNDDFNGMPVEDWNTQMKKDGYVSFTAGAEGVDPGKEVWYPSASDAVSGMKYPPMEDINRSAYYDLSRTPRG